MALVGSARPGKGGLGYKPRSKQNQNKAKPQLVGRAGIGKPGAPKAGFGNKPSFQKPTPAGKPKLGGGAPAAAPKPTVGQHAQPDSLYERQVQTAEHKGEQRLSELDDRERALKFDTGIDDPTNPFSRVNGLKQSFLARRKAASVNLASQGQLYSGAHERAINRTRQEEEQARAQLRQAFDAAIGQIGAERAGVKFATEEERSQAFEDWLARAPESDVQLDEKDEADIEAASERESEPGWGGGEAGPSTSVPMLQRTGGISADSAAAKQITGGLGGRPSGSTRGINGGGMTRAERARIQAQEARKAALKAAKQGQRTAQKRAAKQEAAKQEAAAPAKGVARGVKPKPKPKAQPKRGGGRRGGRR